MSNILTVDPLRLSLSGAIALTVLVTIGVIGCGRQDSSSTSVAELATAAMSPTTAPATAIPLQPSPTPVPATVTPEPTATPMAPTPTQAPRGILKATPGKTPADYTADDLREIAIALTQEFYEAITSQPEPDLARAKRTYSEACQPEDDDEFAAQIDALLEWLDGGQLGIEVLDVARLPDTDDAVIALSIGMIDGERVTGATRSLIVFENGRWVDSDCDMGRALVLGVGGSGGIATPAPSQSTITAIPSASPTLTPTSDSLAFVPGGSPADHTDEQIARSVEAVTQTAWRALLADPPLDMKAIRGLSVQSCQDQTDEELIEFAKTMRSQIGDSEVENVVQAVERVDSTRAWTSGHVEMDGMIIAEVTPTLVAFEDGQWRDADCLPERDASLKRPDHIDADVRKYYIGEPVEMPQYWYPPPYELIVLGPPEMTNDGTARLPVRVTALSDVLHVEDITFSGGLRTTYDHSGNSIEWSSDSECEDNALDSVTLVQGGSHEGFICFSQDEDSEIHPTDDQPFTLFESLYDEDPDTILDDVLISVDLTHAVPAPDRLTFEPDAFWGTAPHATIGDTVRVTSCDDYGEPWLDMTALGQIEPTEDTGIVRVHVRLGSPHSEGKLHLGTNFPFDLATSPSTYGAIHWSLPLWENLDGLLPDSFDGVVLDPGESHEAFVYFPRPEGSSDSEQHSLLVWRNCSPVPIHLRDQG